MTVKSPTKSTKMPQRALDGPQKGHLFMVRAELSSQRGLIHLAWDGAPQITQIFQCSVHAP